MGDLVLHKVFPKIAKFGPRYTGPYVVMDRLSRVNYKIIDRNKSRKYKIVHVNNLKAYYDRDQTTH